MKWSMFLKTFSLSALLLLPRVAAEIRTFDFNVSWVNANPDGLHERRVMGINGQWPIPTVNVNINDTVVVNLYNGLGDRNISLHWHGIYQNGTNHMDGVGQATQCPTPPGYTFTYNFTINQPGTYWYHSHIDGQYPDGLRGPLIVHDANNPFKDQFDEELVITLSDWYHDEMPELLKGFISVTNPTGAEPVPNSALMNDTQNLQIPVAPGKTYFLRIASIAAFAPQYFWIEGHTMRIIEVDGVYHDPAEASMIYIAPAQRYGVLVTTRNDTDANFAIVGSMDTDLFDTVPDTLNPNVTGWLVYDEAKSLPVPANLTTFDPFDDLTLVPTDKMALLENPVMSISVDVIMDNLGDGANYAFFSNITYVRPVVPTLYTVMSAGDVATDSVIYGSATHSFVLNHLEVYEIVVNNHDTGKHPFHLHGHAFQSLVRSDDEAGDWDPEAVKNGSVTFPATPMRRDTLVLRPEGHFVIRFMSDNPGVWLFHCHIEWHVSSGLILTLVEAPLVLQKTLTIPENHFGACAALSPVMPSTGNAAGNTQNLFDLAGENLPPKPLPAGFTPRGIVALTFSIIAGLAGVGVIAWYGLAEVGNTEAAAMKSHIRAEAEAVGITDATTAPTTTVVAGKGASTINTYPGTVQVSETIATPNTSPARQ